MEVIKKFALIVGLLPLVAMPCNGFAEKTGKPYQLQCEALDTPMGVDARQPQLSWKLQDRRFGARQSAYEILVATRPQLLQSRQADVWDSGRVEADRSIDVLYQGPSLQPETRYYWRVQVWDKDGKPYPVSDISWWETGLLDAGHWRAQWIGYEDLEQRSVRAANPQWITNAAVPDQKGSTDTRHDFRLAFDVTGRVRRAVLYVTGEDSAAAWLNGKQVKAAQTLPPWGRTPWKTYQKEDVTAAVRSGKNILAIEILLHGTNSQGQAPMSAALYLEQADGSVEVLKSGDPNWKATLHADGDWLNANYDDGAWMQASLYAPQKDAFGGADELANPMPTAAVAALRRSFEINKRVVSARLYATALGAYKFSVNGKPVGDQILSPGWTDYRQRVTYQVFDVTPLLQQGKNAIGAYLAAGWYSTPLEWVGQGNNYGNTPNALKAQLRIQHTDGTVEWIATDSTWKADTSPITFAEIYNGETYDARKLQPGWDAASYSDAAWHSASVMHPHEPEIVWQSFPPVRVTEILTAKSISSPKPGTYIYDFGQNLAGVARLNVEGKRGTDVQLRFAEVLNADGSIYVENLRNAKATDHYILAGEGREEYQPSFTFHGFRYVELTGVPHPPGIEAVHAVVFHTDAPFTARLKTGSPMLNQLWSNILWGQRSNFVSVPTDCPQRDERLGWSADAQVFWRTASYNMDLTTFSQKYATDLRGTQAGTAMYGIYAPGTWKQNAGYGTGWSDAGIIVPWTSWMQTGDLSIIRQNWNGMKTYLDAILSANPNYLWAKNYGIAFGDWLAPTGATSEELIATAYWAYDVTMMQQMARAIGKNDEASVYADLFSNIKKAFHTAYVQQNGFVGAPISQKSAEPVETQTGYVLALHMNLLPDELRPLAADRLIAMIRASGWKLGTGFLGTPYLLEVLSDTGHADIAYRLLLNTEYPSWGYMVGHGATTMWERWNGDQMRNDPSMNSYNHYAYGAVAEWLYRYAAGIDTVAYDPGFHTILLHPDFDARLGSLEFSYESRYGEIKSSWTDTAGELGWTVTVPANTKAVLPLTESEAQTYMLNGEPITKSHAILKVDKTGTENLYDLGAGVYVLQKHSDSVKR